jgi:hypothetical protein
MRATKSNAVRMMLNENAVLTNKEIAQAVGCDISLVHQLRKVKSVAKRGRPRKVVEPKQISIIEASYALMQVVNGVKDLAISFDNNRDKLDIVWHEELYQIDIADLPKTLDSIKFLENKEVSFNADL